MYNKLYNFCIDSATLTQFLMILITSHHFIMMLSNGKPFTSSFIIFLLYSSVYVFLFYRLQKSLISNDKYTGVLKW